MAVAAAARRHRRRSSGGRSCTRADARLAVLLRPSIPTEYRARGRRACEGRRQAARAAPVRLPGHRHPVLRRLARRWRRGGEGYRRIRRNSQHHALDCCKREKVGTGGTADDDDVVEDGGGGVQGGGGRASDGGGDAGSSATTKADPPPGAVAGGGRPRRVGLRGLPSRVDRAWTVKVVSLAHQEVRRTLVERNIGDALPSRSVLGGGGRDERPGECGGRQSAPRVLGERGMPVELVRGWRRRRRRRPDGSHHRRRAGGIQIPPGWVEEGGPDLRPLLGRRRRGRARSFAHSRGQRRGERGGRGREQFRECRRGASTGGGKISQVGPAIGASFVALLALVAIVVAAFMFRRRHGDEGRDGSMGKKATSAVVDIYIFRFRSYLVTDIGRRWVAKG